jgi:hypothetical protein
MNEIQHLAMCVRSGDAAATADFRRQLETEIKRIVRRTVRTRSAVTPLAKRILAEADCLRPHSPGETGSTKDWVVAKVCSRICDVVVHRLAEGGTPSRHAHETVPN